MGKPKDFKHNEEDFSHNRSLEIKEIDEPIPNNESLPILEIPENKVEEMQADCPQDSDEELTTGSFPVSCTNAIEDYQLKLCAISNESHKLTAKTSMYMLQLCIDNYNVVFYIAQKTIDPPKRVRKYPLKDVATISYVADVRYELQISLLILLLCVDVCCRTGTTNFLLMGSFLFTLSWNSIYSMSNTQMVVVLL